MPQLQRTVVNTGRTGACMCMMTAGVRDNTLDCLRWNRMHFSVLRQVLEQ
jgi:hypothetical protein